MNTASDSFVYFDPRRDFEASLTILCDSLENLKSNPFFLKSAVIHAVLALQGACVCSLVRSDGTGAFEKRTERQIREYFDLQSQKAMCDAKGVQWILEDKDFPEERLASLSELLMRLPADLRVSIKGPTDNLNETARAVAFLKELRDDFVHFKTSTHLIHPKSTLNAIRCTVLLAQRIVAAQSNTSARTISFAEVEGLFKRALALLDEHPI
ncbi:hypothetical protein GQ651_14840 [Alphaproteobacteria bacterium GH1-50]|uniref:Uncharacterized protein n=1 Tax=Kangsaoukella pontilimi TaxID=2691042 RepID=A0A7C9IJU7_9RHOB|nr:hypothetical protein [Kangsaoukella pontilimi]MXQ09122.1 hypothetical protein [Kangsaoukella pontilimi]